MGLLDQLVRDASRPINGLLRAAGTSKVNHSVSDWFLTPPGGFIARRGTQDWLNSYSQSPWIRAIVGAISNAVVSQPWDIFVPDTSSQATAPKQIQRYTPWSVERMLMPPVYQQTLADLL